MLQSILMLLSQHRRDGTLPDFSVLRSMLSYVDEFSEKRHHRKETELLFPKLRARAPQAGPVLDQLDGEHASGEKCIQHLGHVLLGFKLMGEPGRQAFEQATKRCVSFYLGHMALEEQNILPLAETVLSDADWAELDQAFAGNRDPLHRARARGGLSRTLHPHRQHRAGTGWAGRWRAISLTASRRPRVEPSLGALNDRGFLLQLSAMA